LKKKKKIGKDIFKIWGECQSLEEGKRRRDNFLVPENLLCIKCISWIVIVSCCHSEMPLLVVLKLGLMTREEEKKKKATKNIKVQRRFAEEKKRKKEKENHFFKKNNLQLDTCLMMCDRSTRFFTNSRCRLSLNGVSAGLSW